MVSGHVVAGGEDLDCSGPGHKEPEGFPLGRGPPGALDVDGEREHELNPLPQGEKRLGGNLVNANRPTGKPGCRGIKPDELFELLADEHRSTRGKPPVPGESQDRRPAHAATWPATAGSRARL